jgi:diaminobutyrate-2-oxoglutarate transaminase
VADTAVFEEFESEVRNYCRFWPTVFSHAKGSTIYDEDGRAYIDFFAGAGSLNYGHSHPKLKAALLEYLQQDLIVQSLDMFTSSKRDFLEALQRNILSPRGLRYKVQFPGPAGCTAVEAALKLARKYTGRRSIVTFSNAFHGMTLGALSVSASVKNRTGSHVCDTVVLPYDQDGAEGAAATSVLDCLLDDGAIDTPAALIVETVQGEGGMRAASVGWLRQLASFCQQRGVLLILDDVQMGCGRTGPFFSFEPAGIKPDIVCLSKSLSGYGLPFALILLRPELDAWQPGEHSGTFRGPNLAFVTAVAAMDLWREQDLERCTASKGQLIESTIRAIAAEHEGSDDGAQGRGMAWGISFREPGLGRRICRGAFERGLLVEPSGPREATVKLMPPLTITHDELRAGLDILRAEVKAASGARTTPARKDPLAWQLNSRGAT